MVMSSVIFSWFWRLQLTRLSFDQMFIFTHLAIISTLLMTTYFKNRTLKCISHYNTEVQGQIYCDFLAFFVLIQIVYHNIFSIISPSFTTNCTLRLYPMFSCCFASSVTFFCLLSSDSSSVDLCCRRVAVKHQLHATWRHAETQHIVACCSGQRA